MTRGGRSRLVVGILDSITGTVRPATSAPTIGPARVMVGLSVAGAGL
ncbi:MAG: hypothetical protein ACRCYX_03115 [Dermatophilaceae bacterium]